MRTLALSFCLTLSMAACGAGDTGPAADQLVPVNFSMQLVGAAAAPSFLKAPDPVIGSLSVTAATVNVRDIEFDAPQGWTCQRFQGGVTNGTGRQADCDDGAQAAKIRFEGPFRINLLTGASTPALDALLIPAGTYKRIDLRIDDVTTEGEDDVMENLSLLTHGSYVDADSNSRALRIAIKFNEDIRFEGPKDTGIVIDGVGSEAIVVRLQENNWFAGVEADLADCAADQPGTGLINIDEEAPSACKAVEGTLKENFKLIGQLDKQE